MCLKNYGFMIIILIIQGIEWPWLYSPYKSVIVIFYSMLSRVKPPATKRYIPPPNVSHNVNPKSKQTQSSRKIPERPIGRVITVITALYNDIWNQPINIFDLSLFKDYISKKGKLHINI